VTESDGEPRRVAYCLLGQDGRIIVAQDSLEPFYAASTIKLAVMATAARAVDAGELAWDVPIEAQGPTVRELVADMIELSSNEATNVLARRLGFASITEVLSDADAEGCRMERLIGDRAATDAGLTNEVTPAGLARLLWSIVTGRLSSPASRELMVEQLRRQQFPVIADVLAPGTPWGSKSGWVDWIDHDAAFVGSPSDRFLVLAVCTAGFPGREGLAEIRRVAASVLPPEVLKRVRA